MKNVIKEAIKVSKSTENKNVKEIMGVFTTSCPGCGSGRIHWKIDICEGKRPPIVPGAEYDIVRYKCRCGAIFKKVEEK